MAWRSCSQPSLPSGFFTGPWCWWLRASRRYRWPPPGNGTSRMRLDVLIGLIVVFAPLSLAAVGGVSSVFASIQHQSVDVHHWVTNREFVELFAIARGSPGPGSMLV